MRWMLALATAVAAGCGGRDRVAALEQRTTALEARPLAEPDPRLGQTAVPVFWINGRPLEGAMPIEQFRAMIDDELAKAKADRAKGGKPASYYDRLMRRALAP